MMDLDEKDKKPGLFYARDGAGLELPVVDVERPEFRVELSEGELEERLKAFVKEQAGHRRMPALFRRWVLPLILKRARLGRGLLAARGGFMDGMTTYLMKLPPELMGRAWAGKLDKAIASSYAGLSMRLRSGDMARTLAQAVAPLLWGAPGRPLRLLNLGGGPGMDSLNALMLLRGGGPDPLAGRALGVEIWDLDPAGPAFGSACLAALGGPKAPCGAWKWRGNTRPCAGTRAARWRPGWPACPPTPWWRCPPKARCSTTVRTRKSRPC